MYLMYVDESGDPGMRGSPTRYFVLSGVVLHELHWQTCLANLIRLRRGLRQNYMFKLREEFHASAMLNSPGDLCKRIKRNDRLAIIRNYADTLATWSDISLINVVVDKQWKPYSYDVFENGWKVLIQRFENTIIKNNFPRPSETNDLSILNDRGVIFCDNTDGQKLHLLYRKLRRYNPVPNSRDPGYGYRNLPIQFVIEDPILRNSDHSYFIQTADLVTFLLYQQLQPSAYIQKKMGTKLF